MQGSAEGKAKPISDASVSSCGAVEALAGEAGIPTNSMLKTTSKTALGICLSIFMVFLVFPLPGSSLNKQLARNNEPTVLYRHSSKPETDVSSACVGTRQLDDVQIYFPKCGSA